MIMLPAKGSETDSIFLYIIIITYRRVDFEAKAMEFLASMRPVAKAWPQRLHHRFCGLVHVMYFIIHIFLLLIYYYYY
jgi:hypothetical protein